MIYHCAFFIPVTLSCQICEDCYLLYNGKWGDLYDSSSVCVSDIFQFSIDIFSHIQSSAAPLSHPERHLVLIQTVWALEVLTDLESSNPSRIHLYFFATGLSQTWVSLKRWMADIGACSESKAADLSGDYGKFLSCLSAAQGVAADALEIPPSHSAYPGDMEEIHLHAARLLALRQDGEAKCIKNWR